MTEPQTTSTSSSTYWSPCPYCTPRCPYCGRPYTLQPIYHTAYPGWLGNYTSTSGTVTFTARNAGGQ